MSANGQLRHVKRRAPRGVETDKPVWVRMLPGERACFDALNAAAGFSNAEFGRQMLVKGLRAEAEESGRADLLDRLL